MKDITKHYSNGDLTIVWKPSLCSHSARCFNGLGEVFHPKTLPWITPEGADTERIIQQIHQCPSGALSYVRKEKQDEMTIETETIVEPTANGPLLVYGNVTIKHADGTSTKKSKVTAFCRCGSSENKPFCDGTHRKVDFKA